MEERTERESDSRRREEKWQTCWCYRDQQRAFRMVQDSAQKLEHTGPAEKERVASVPQSEQLTRTPEPPLPKQKGRESSVQIMRGGEGQGEREPHLGERGITARDGVERVNSTVKEDRFQGGKGGQARRAFLGEVEESMSG